MDNMHLQAAGQLYDPLAFPLAKGELVGVPATGDASRDLEVCWT